MGVVAGSGHYRTDPAKLARLTVSTCWACRRVRHLRQVTAHRRRHRLIILVDDLDVLSVVPDVILFAAALYGPRSALYEHFFALVGRLLSPLGDGQLP